MYWQNSFPAVWQSAIKVENPVFISEKMPFGFVCGKDVNDIFRKKIQQILSIMDILNSIFSVSESKIKTTVFWHEIKYFDDTDIIYEQKLNRLKQVRNIGVFSELPKHEFNEIEAIACR